LSQNSQELLTIDLSIALLSLYDHHILIDVAGVSNEEIHGSNSPTPNYRKIL